MLAEQIRIARELQEILYFAVVEMEGVEVFERSDALDRDFAAALAELQQRYESPADAHPLFEPARKMYRAVGIDPTRIRPSSEALARRVLKSRDLYRINSVVDCFNSLSMLSGIPVGLYDADHVHPPVELRLGKEGEGYPGIGKEYVNVAGRFCLVDQQGPFGNPSSDSARTRIRPGTQNLLACYFVPAAVPEAEARKLLERSRELLGRHHPRAAMRLFFIRGGAMEPLP